jgi:IS5 family transposase
VFRTISGPVPAWESQLPPELLRLPEELARVDALLDDPAFFAPFAPYSIRCWAGCPRRLSATCG